MRIGQLAMFATLAFASCSPAGDGAGKAPDVQQAEIKVGNQLLIRDQDGSLIPIDIAWERVGGFEPDARYVLSHEGGDWNLSEVDAATLTQLQKQKGEPDQLAQRLLAEGTIYAASSDIILLSSGVVRRVRATRIGQEATVGSPSLSVLGRVETTADGNSVYAGFDYGEWGGQLGKLDLRTGKFAWTNYQGGPVRSLVADSGQPDCMYVATGLEHIGVSAGGVSRICGDNVEEVFSKEHHIEGVGVAGSEAVYGLAATGDGLVLSTRSGIYSVRDGAVTRLDLRWRRTGDIEISSVSPNVILVRSCCEALATPVLVTLSEEADD